MLIFGKGLHEKIMQKNSLNVVFKLFLPDEVNLLDINCAEVDFLEKR